MLERLAELKGDINRKRSSAREPQGDQDDLGRAIAELHQKYIGLMKELEKERRKQVSASCTKRESGMMIDVTVVPGVVDDEDGNSGFYDNSGYTDYS